MQREDGSWSAASDEENSTPYLAMNIVRKNQKYQDGESRYTTIKVDQIEELQESRYSLRSTPTLKNKSHLPKGMLKDHSYASLVHWAGSVAPPNKDLMDVCNFTPILGHRPQQGPKFTKQQKAENQKQIQNITENLAQINNQFAKIASTHQIPAEPHIAHTTLVPHVQYKKRKLQMELLNQSSQQSLRQSDEIKMGIISAAKDKVIQSNISPSQSDYMLVSSLDRIKTINQSPESFLNLEIGVDGMPNSENYGPNDLQNTYSFDSSIQSKAVIRGNKKSAVKIVKDKVRNMFDESNLSPTMVAGEHQIIVQPRNIYHLSNLNQKAQKSKKNNVNNAQKQLKKTFQNNIEQTRNSVHVQPRQILGASIEKQKEQDHFEESEEFAQAMRNSQHFQKKYSHQGPFSIVALQSSKHQYSKLQERIPFINKLPQIVQKSNRSRESNQEELMQQPGFEDQRLLPKDQGISIINHSLDEKLLMEQELTKSFDQLIYEPNLKSHSYLPNIKQSSTFSKTDQGTLSLPALTTLRSSINLNQPILAPYNNVLNKYTIPGGIAENDRENSNHSGDASFLTGTTKNLQTSPLRGFSTASKQDLQWLEKIIPEESKGEEKQLQTYLNQLVKEKIITVGQSRQNPDQTLPQSPFKSKESGNQFQKQQQVNQKYQNSKQKQQRQFLNQISDADVNGSQINPLSNSSQAKTLQIPLTQNQPGEADNEITSPQSKQSNSMSPQYSKLLKTGPKQMVGEFQKDLKFASKQLADGIACVGGVFESAAQQQSAKFGKIKFDEYIQKRSTNLMGLTGGKIRKGPAGPTINSRNSLKNDDLSQRTGSENDSNQFQFQNQSGIFANIAVGTSIGNNSLDSKNEMLSTQTFFKPDDSGKNQNEFQQNKTILPHIQDKTAYFQHEKNQILMDAENRVTNDQNYWSTMVCVDGTATFQGDAQNKMAPKENDTTPQTVRVESPPSRCEYSDQLRQMGEKLMTNKVTKEMKNILSSSVDVYSFQNDSKLSRSSSVTADHLQNKTIIQNLSSRKLVYVNGPGAKNTLDETLHPPAGRVDFEQQTDGRDESNLQIHFENNKSIDNDIQNLIRPTPLRIHDIDIAVTPNRPQNQRNFVQIKPLNTLPKKIQNFSDLNAQTKLKIIMETRLKLQKQFINSVKKEMKPMTKKSDSSGHFDVNNFSQIYQKQKQQLLRGTQREKSTTVNVNSVNRSFQQDKVKFGERELCSPRKRSIVSLSDRKYQVLDKNHQAQSNQLQFTSLSKTQANSQIIDAIYNSQIKINKLQKHGATLNHSQIQLKATDLTDAGPHLGNGKSSAALLAGVINLNPMQNSTLRPYSQRHEEKAQKNLLQEFHNDPCFRQPQGPLHYKGNFGKQSDHKRVQDNMKKFERDILQIHKRMLTDYHLQELQSIVEEVGVHDINSSNQNSSCLKRDTVRIPWSQNTKDGAEDFGISQYKGESKYPAPSKGSKVGRKIVNLKIQKGSQSILLKNQQVEQQDLLQNQGAHDVKIGPNITKHQIQASVYAKAVKEPTEYKLNILESGTDRSPAPNMPQNGMPKTITPQKAKESHGKIIPATQRKAVKEHQEKQAKFQMIHFKASVLAKESGK